MKSNDDDIKIFHPAKKDSGGADLAELALLMDKYRGNGNMEKAAELGLIDGYCLGDLTDRQARAWLRETAEAMPGGSAR